MDQHGLLARTKSWSRGGPRWRVPDSKGRYSALQALDFVIAHADLHEAQARASRANFRYALDRLLATPDVRAAIGLELNNGSFKRTSRQRGNQASERLVMILQKNQDRSVMS